ncbi:MAG: glycosyltransferase [Lachnospiraceae bacterium]|nr:glycosyltransferase [Lachnospiraceae bacterium]
MKHVAIITNIPAPYRVDFFDYLQKSYTDYRFTIIYSSRNEDNRSWEIDQTKMNNCVFLDSKTIKIKKRYDTRYIHIPWGVSKVLDKLKPDVVVGSEYNPTILQAVVYCKRKKIPYVSWTDGTLFSERNFGRVQLLARKFVVSKADAFIGSSTKSKEAQIYYGADEKKCHISYLAVDVDKYIQKPQGNGKGKILCVGSLIERKGVDLLFNALIRVQSDFELYLAGGGDEKENLKKLAKELKIENQVHFLGQLSRKELLKHYADSDLFVLPTREDCFALVILEAMCSELPIVCSKYADGAYDLIEEGKNGFVADPYDAKAFAEKIDLLLKDKVLREKMREQSKEVLDKFRFANISKGYMAAIEESMRR